jgi:DNA-binding GntR family transcriptional regulator
MGEALMRDEQPADIWDQHAEILEAIVQGDAERAEPLGRRHITQAAGFMVARLSASDAAAQAPAAIAGK